MATRMTGGTSPPRLRRFARGVAVISILLIAWLVVGLLRMDGLARAYLRAQNPGQSVENVTVYNRTPAIPPFWTVGVSGEVAGPGGFERPGGSWSSR